MSKNSYTTKDEIFHIMRPDEEDMTCCGLSVSPDETHNRPEQDRTRICFDCVNWNAIVADCMFKTHWLLRDFRRIMLDVISRTASLSPSLNQTAYDYIKSHHVEEAHPIPGRTELQLVREDSYVS